MFAQLAQLEGPVLLWIQENLRGTLDWLVSLYTQLGNAGLLWVALSLAMLAWKPTRRAGLTALVAMVFGLLVAVVNRLSHYQISKKKMGCENCPSRAGCGGHCASPAETEGEVK